MKKKPSILFVAYPNNIHSVRWISQLTDSEYKVYLFPSQRIPLHKQFKNITYFSSNFFRPKNIDKSVHWLRWPSLAFYLDLIITKVFHHDTNRFFQSLALKLIIIFIRPDIIHSLEMQHAGYLTAQVKRSLKAHFPKWIISIWGSDLYLFGRLHDHEIRIRNVLESLDYILCENPRDNQLAKELGFLGTILTNLPGPGGIDFSSIKYSEANKPSERKVILLKGYQNWSGRALVGLTALSKCADLLHDFEIRIFYATYDVEIAAELFSKKHLVKVTLINPMDFDEFIKNYQMARIYLGLSISDGTPNSMLEAMAFGAFPIQSNTAYTEGWLENGKTGFIVPPEEPSIIAKYLYIALTDDNLVNNAAKNNEKLIRSKLDSRNIKSKTLKMYKEILNNVKP